MQDMAFAPHITGFELKELTAKNLDGKDMEEGGALSGCLVKRVALTYDAGSSPEAQRPQNYPHTLTALPRRPQTSGAYCTPRR